MLFIIVALIATLACIIINYFIRKFFPFEAVNTLPGPVRLPLIGTSYIFLQQKSEDFLSIIMQMCEKFSSPFQFWIGPKLVFVIYEPDQIKTVLQSHFCLDKSMMYNAVKPIFGSGLLTAPGTMIGIKVKENILNEIVEALGRMKKIIGARFRNAFLIPDFIFNFTSMGSTQRKTIIFVQSLIDKVIQQWTNESNTTNVNDGITRKRLVNILMSSTHNKKFTEKEIFYHLITMLITASDTIAVTMYFVIFVLANFSEIQEKVYKELLEIYGTKTPKAAPVKYEDLQRMNYLERVIKETLRIFPTGPVIAREVTEDVKIGLLIFKNLLHLLLIFFEIFVIIKHE
ncbi:cytochrome P450 4c21 isoform X5 [Solenopsis invicta]|uniref:cytochrome P450 4c21 isoform X5 n=1 Tax=Solenopsis invicta TaxID=13686 RepID=UPI00193E8794|nr:cytochrome P450 4c21 isoform X5 [Solenopsis invicta]